jgi:hypothetical protein
MFPNIYIMSTYIIAQKHLMMVTWERNISYTSLYTFLNKATQFQNIIKEFYRKEWKHKAVFEE